MQIAIFARAPVAGAAKTRLIPRLGAAGAARAHRSMVLCAIDNALRAALGPVTLWTAGDADHRFFRALRRSGHIARVHPQRGDDLGARMAHCLASLLPAGPVLLMGSDCPALGPPELQACARSLEAGDDAVLIPAEDGGYVLVGAARELPPDIFRGIPWGQDSVMEATRQRLAAHHLRWSEPALLWDVDHPRDLDRAAALSGLASARPRPP
ncbi:MAG: TIGR04282 family arsenosugar biosynthesis glycosyltransferase [Zoogloeaceae bacterium]|nr:TIGR04282 family arsenosugar biosynthesis glycosyltransferase [Rhodocyclaceae bacterium]MCP5233055.1 TIGR04282 family arsenosugar biosynthesis glycosyltransferase [Zoogloeaceae bacterium]MCP5239816.1 TIGR04282 family arsenosugar biosynthesis glycosyltransferase [Zoogloeaceae bacterium]MCP5253947.1 TIGR04282 family arsenosugar biosynthesis glycosyltransferase [Zoogloeaceae bacterium]MCP5293661.1 TIGR04282 family arsenosugar biosynthesis glycosyltransferase [Zoogloeaceae bacterium]